MLPIPECFQCRLIAAAITTSPKPRPWTRGALYPIGATEGASPILAKPRPRPFIDMHNASLATCNLVSEGRLAQPEIRLRLHISCCVVRSCSTSNYFILPTMGFTAPGHI
jgi:hypothetical protein